MPRLLAAVLAALLVVVSGTAAAQEAKAPAQGAAAPEADPKVQAAIKAAVDKAKEELRNEMRAELQGAQSAAEFMGTVAEQPKTDLVELDGYYRLRGQMLNKLHLRGGTDSAGFRFFPKPLRAGNTIADANMRLRLEPTINASETVRVRAQIDVLDNYVLGSSTSKVTDSTGSPYPIPFYGSTRTYTNGDSTNDRDPIIPRRVWGELQTPVGLLSFGRMPSSWGLGLLANAGTGLDQDFGDTVDRIQFALPPVSTPVGQLVFVPIIDFDAEGVLFRDPHANSSGGQDIGSVGQPLDADGGDDARTLAFKVVRLDDEDELRRKLDRGESSLNWGLYYNLRKQRYVYPAWLDEGFAGSYDSTEGTTTYRRRGATAHFGSLWARWLSPKIRIEGELVGVYGEIGNANAGVSTTDATVPSASAIRGIHMRQWGGVLQTEIKQSPKFSWGVELGAASGDSAPGFGNLPDRGWASNASLRPNYGALEGPQWGRGNDRSVDNFRFNPAYQVDLIFYRRILGQVTDSLYLKPSIRWNIIPGLVLDSSVMYAQAMRPESTPSSSSREPLVPDSPLEERGKRPLALEWDSKLSLSPTRAFTGWIDLGLLKPLSGMGSGTSVAWMTDFGLAVRF